MIRTFLATIALTLPSAALADTQLERLEALSETMNTEMVKMMAREIESKGGDSGKMMDALPDMSWDADYREAGECLLKSYRDLIGNDGVDQMLDKMDEVLPQLENATMDTMEDLNILPDGVTEDQSIEVTQKCGLMSLASKRMAESGFTAAMMEAYGSIPDND